MTWRHYSIKAAKARLSFYCIILVLRQDHPSWMLYSNVAARWPAAQNAQVALFSLNKFLPVADGAILCSNRRDIDVSLDERGLVELPSHVQRAYQDHLQSARELFEASDSARAKILLSELASSYERYYAFINVDLRPFRQSARSRRVEDAFPFAGLVERRSGNARILYQRLDNPIFSLVHAKLPPAVVPFCIPARVPARNRSELIERLFDQGVLLSTLEQKWNFIPAGQRERYSVEAAFLDEHVLIPVSEFISGVSMDEMVMRFNNVKLDSPKNGIH
jgi:hypothetical protein